jgi:hypothetical protein
MSGHSGARQRTEKSYERSQRRQFGSTGKGEGHQHDVAGHVRGEDMAERKETSSINKSGDKCENEKSAI